MPSATLGQINARLDVIDALLFQIATGQASASAEEQQNLAEEADWIMDALAKGISEGGQYDYEAALAERQKVREMNRLAAMTARYTELYPDPNPVADAIAAKALAYGATKEDIEALARMYCVIFVDYTAPPVPPPPRLGLLRRLFSRR